MIESVSKMYLNIQWKVVKSHWTNPNNSTSHSINKFKVPIEPQSFKFGQNIQGLELLKIQNFYIRNPDFVNLEKLFVIQI